MAGWNLAAGWARSRAGKLDDGAVGLAVERVGGVLIGLEFFPVPASGTGVAALSERGRGKCNEREEKQTRTEQTLQSGATIKERV